VLGLVLIATATALATGLGASPVSLLGDRAVRMRPALLGLSAGVMTTAAVAGLLLPALEEGGSLDVGLGLAAGLAFLLVARRVISVGPADAFSGPRRTSILIFVVLFVHSLPEGLAIGTAYASETDGLALFIVVAIRISEHSRGHQRGDSDAGCRLSTLATALGSGGNQRAAAVRCCDRLPGGRAGRGAIAAFLCVRRRRDADAGCDRGVS